ncbi:unnamed protein product [Ilex paraguariensis]|uniref:CBS domain-containing protein n=1 Tax=Ilex paraguariensis TaxID=185542 RepID=A0ABC8SH08_9AQUA
MEMFIDLHPFTNASPYTVVETMSLAKALILFREVGLRHLLVIPKISGRLPVVGILTRHDFMPEHILGLHPFLVRSRASHPSIRIAPGISLWMLLGFIRLWTDPRIDIIILFQSYCGSHRAFGFQMFDNTR